MDTLFSLFVAYPFWGWLSLGVGLLLLEAILTTEWLLWPAVAAGIVSVLALIGVPKEVAGQGMVFGVLTLLGVVFARPLLARNRPMNPDINDPSLRLVGQAGEVAEVFRNGTGRVFVDGAEWIAEVEPQQRSEFGALGLGERVTVTSVSGARVVVKVLPHEI